MNQNSIYHNPEPTPKFEYPATYATNMTCGFCGKRIYAFSGDEKYPPQTFPCCRKRENLKK
jgi:hypothetical protein